jgi:hypothetical protein
MAILSHKIPQAYLRRFSSPGKRGRGKLWVYEKGRLPRIGSPKSEAAERGFFAQKTNTGALDDAAAEAMTARIEDRALEVFHCAENQCYVWTDKHRTRMAEYWALLFIRASATFHMHREKWHESLVKAKEKIETDKSVRQDLARRYSFLIGRNITEQEVLQMFQRVIPNLMDESEMRHGFVSQLERRVELFSKILLAKPWQVWMAPAGSEFITSDTPVVTMQIDEFGQYRVGWGFNRENVIALMPMSRRACLAAGTAQTHYRVVDASYVEASNKSVITCSHRFAYSRTLDPSIDALVQSSLGSIRYGVDAFRGESFDVIDLLQ